MVARKKFVFKRVRVRGPVTRTSPLTVQEAVEYFQSVMSAGPVLNGRSVQDHKMTCRSLLQELNAAGNGDTFTATEVKKKY